MSLRPLCITETSLKFLWLQSTERKGLFCLPKRIVWVFSKYWLNLKQGMSNLTSSLTEFSFLAVLWLGEYQLHRTAQWLDTTAHWEDSNKGQMVVQTSFHLPTLGKEVGTGLVLLSRFALCVYNTWIFLTSLRMKFSKASHVASNEDYSLAGILLLFLAQLSLPFFFFYGIWNKVNLIYSEMLHSSSSCAVIICLWANPWKCYTHDSSTNKVNEE